MSTSPLCFVLMPFGDKPDGTGGTICFDAVYAQVIRPAIEQAGMQPLRADEEQLRGIIHQSMFERLLLCDYAVADLTGANANVCYELGIRHAMRPHSTVLVHAEGVRLPFDLAPMRSLPYHLAPDGTPRQALPDGAALEQALRGCRHQQTVDSPLYQLVRDLPSPEIKRLKTDTFRERSAYNEGLRAQLAQARTLPNNADQKARLLEIQQQLHPLTEAEAGVVVDLLLSLRGIKAWSEMEGLVKSMAPPLAQTVLVQEQLGFALNRLGRRQEAEQVLEQVIARHGPSSETLGLLGRVYKDRWEEAVNANQPALAKGLLEKAIRTYLQGFECDWRDAYPGINALTLMEIRDPPDPRRIALHGVVAYAVERRLATRQPDYWDHATRLELAVLKEDQAAAEAALSESLAAVREVWEPETTQRNLRLIREGRQRRGLNLGWDLAIETALLPP